MLAASAFIFNVTVVPQRITGDYITFLPPFLFFFILLLLLLILARFVNPRP